MNRWIYIAIFLLLMSGCGSPSTMEKPGVSVSILPLKYFVDRISGGDFEVTVLVPPGASPESYEPTPRQLADVVRSDVYFCTGLLDFERSTSSAVRENIPAERFVDLSAGLSLLRGGDDPARHQPVNAHHHGIDPHTWLSPRCVKTMLERIEQTLTAVRPDSAAKYARNKALFISSIDSLDRDNHSIFEQIEKRTILIYHPFLTYFASDYGLTQTAIEQEGKEPSAGQFQKLLEQAEQEGVGTVFFQQELHAPTIRAFVRENGLMAVSLDPLAYDWLENMGHISLSVRKSLE
jgi:zinc transport system substrate-binding protein